MGVGGKVGILPAGESLGTKNHPLFVSFRVFRGSKCLSQVIDAKERRQGKRCNSSRFLVICFRHMSNDITQLLQASSRGDRLASEELLPVVYEELRRIALVRMNQERPGQTLQATALVHEAWLELVDDKDRGWENRAHFFGAAAHAMRRILMLKARRKSRLKHGGGQMRVDVADVEIAANDPDEKILLINEALERLEREDPEQARVVVLKFFGGLTNEQVAASLEISPRSVDRQWACAKAWLVQWTRQQV